MFGSKARKIEALTEANARLEKKLYECGKRKIPQPLKIYIDQGPKGLWRINASPRVKALFSSTGSFSTAKEAEIYARRHLNCEWIKTRTYREVQRDRAKRARKRKG